MIGVVVIADAEVATGRGGIVEGRDSRKFVVFEGFCEGFALERAVDAF